jgi:hypothetical protein
MRRTLCVLGGLVLGAALSQFPEYAQQYTQRLGGAVDELRTITAEFDSAATGAGMTRQQALDRYAHSPDTFLVGRGTSMNQTFARYALLSSTLQTLKAADPWQRFTLLPSYFDSDVGRRTLSDFKPAVPVTQEGLIYGGIGFVLGYLIVGILVALCLLPFRRFRRRREVGGWSFGPRPQPRFERVEREVAPAVVLSADEIEAPDEEPERRPAKLTETFERREPLLDTPHDHAPRGI